MDKIVHHYSNISSQSSLVPPSSSSSSSSDLTLSYSNEIIQSFQVFDTERTGTISINDLKLILRALGFRVTKQSVLYDVLESNRRRGIIQQQQQKQKQQSALHLFQDSSDDDDDNNSSGMTKDIDLETVLDVILNPDSKYNRENQTEEQMKMMHKINFRLFDVENKGYITASNLKRVLQEIREYSSKGIAKEGDDCSLSQKHNALLNDIDDNELRAMIEMFDGDQDGMINEEEFRRIMENKY